MKSKLIAAGALAAALLVTGALTGTGSAYAASAPAPAKYRVMLAGDSITEGTDGDYTWRYRFYSELQRQGVAGLVDLVGPKRTPRGTYGNYLGGRAWDTDHAATSRTTLAYQVNHVAALVEQYDPDALVSYLGTNDFLNVLRTNPRKSSAQLLALFRARIDQVMANWERYVATVRAENPSIKIVLGELISPRVPAQIRYEYNSALNDFAARLSSNPLSGFRVEVAQLDSPLWSDGRYLYDRTHPAPTGEAMLAQLFADRLASVTSSQSYEYGIFRSKPAIQRPFIAWNPPLRVKVSVSGKKVQVNWTYAARSVRATRMRFRVEPVKAGHARTTPFTPSAKRTSVKLKPGTYRVRVQANRVAMNSTWSKPYLIRVK